MSEKEKRESFEGLMQTLENIVQTLEKGDLNLDDSVSKFEEGMRISKQCSKMLEDSEKKISILLEKSNGEIEEENFSE
jgi:exodeoxyribonuclease VII small subunit